MGGEKKGFYVKLVLGVGCIVAGVLAGQLVDQRLMLVAMFPAVALLSGVIAALTAPRVPKPRSEETPRLSAAERKILAAVWNAGALRPAEAAERASLPETEAASVLSELARKGYLETREESGTPVYARRRKEPPRKEPPKNRSSGALP